MGKMKDLVGKKFGKLTVLSFLEIKKSKPYWNCLCDCGNITVTSSNCLVSKTTRSCGCLKAEKVIEACKTHGLTKSVEFQTWAGIKRRCYNPNNKDYKHYGGRGITVCDRWLDSFENFLEDMGFKPSKKHSIDRKDSNGNYEPSNCRWATDLEQQRNKRSNRKVINTETNEIFNTIKEAADSINMSNGKLRYQLVESVKNKTNLKFL